MTATSAVPSLTARSIPGPVATAVEARLRAWGSTATSSRVWKKDPSVWPKAAPDSVRTRLGWLHLPETMVSESASFAQLAQEVRDDGIREAVVLGMGGSSLAPHVYASTFAPRSGYPRLRVLDTTHPSAIRALRSSLDLPHTVFVVSSKSGTTLEPNSFFAYFWSELSAVTEHPERHFVAVTDPGTTLESLARDRKFRRCICADPEVGGRYSALTAFGLVPAALIGIDLDGLLASARRMASACGPEVAAEDHPGLRLGALLGEMALAGRDKVTFETSPTFDAYPAWAEQLIAESTGKSGTGIVPVAGEVEVARPPFRDDLVLAYLGLAAESQAEEAMALQAAIAAGAPALWTDLDDPLALGGEFFRWEFGVAMAGAVLGIDPFDQPDVEVAKELARQAMEHAGAGPAAPLGVAASDAASLRRAVNDWVAEGRPGDYAAIQAYLEPSAPNTEALQGVRGALHGTLRLATTLGFGPRFLHSTGQLHKGGPPTGLYLQIVDTPREDVPIPGTSSSFGAVIRAQAVGDAGALARVHRRVLTVNVGVDPVVGLGVLAEAIAAAAPPATAG